MKFKLLKSSSLTGNRIAVGTLQKAIKKQTYPVYYNSYKPKNAWVAIPLDKLEEMVIKIGDKNDKASIKRVRNRMLKDKQQLLSSLKTKYWERRQRQDATEKN